MDAAHRKLTTHIRAFARRKRWSCNQVADFAGVSRGYLSEVLSGRKSPSLRTLVKIAAALEVEVRDLVE